jgi:hypothetical protein
MHSSANSLKEFKHIPLLYLTNFYTSLPHDKIITHGIDTYAGYKLADLNGLPTKILFNEVQTIKDQNNWKQVILYCEPILGTNQQSITYKNHKLSAEQRYKQIIDYYCKNNLNSRIETNNTLHNYLWNDGRIQDTKVMRCAQYGLL